MDERDEVNAEWTDLMVRKRSFPPNIKLTDQAKQMFFMISYNLDKFREFVFESSFLKRTPWMPKPGSSLKPTTWPCSNSASTG